MTSDHQICGGLGGGPYKGSRAMRGTENRAAFVQEYVSVNKIPLEACHRTQRVSRAIRSRKYCTIE